MKQALHWTLRNGLAIAAGCYVTCILLAVAATLTEFSIARQEYVNTMITVGVGGTVLGIASLIYWVDNRGNN